MKLVTYEVATPIGPLERIGALLDSRVVDLTLAYAAYLASSRGLGAAGALELAAALLPPGDMVAFLRCGAPAREAASAAVEYARGHRGFPEDVPAPTGGVAVLALGQVRLRAPLPRPTSLRDAWVFEGHATNVMRKIGGQLSPLWYEIPTYYRTSHTNIAGPDDPILWPSYTEKLDYELEFACVIGKEGKNIPLEQVHEYIAGYTVYNDVSCRDIQFREGQLGVGPNKGKNFENCNIMGPCLVTSDEFDPSNAKMYARCNGEPWSEGNTGDMYFSFLQIIEYMSRDEPLFPGEIIGSGTVGSGCSLEHDRWLKPGDVIELEVEGIGVLRNPVVRAT